MAIKKAGGKVEETLGAVASMNPDNMLAGGLMDDFDGTITKARLVPWDYNGAIDHHVLAVALTILPDDGEGDEFTQHYSAGDLEQFAPSMDGKTAVDLENGEGEELEGIYAIRVGKKEQLSNNSNWASFLVALRDAGFDTSKMTAAVSFTEGIYAHWNRIPQKKRSGIVVNVTKKEGDRPRNNDILVITELKEAQAGKATTKAKSAPAKAAKGSDDGDLSDKVTEVIVAAIEKAGDDGLPKSKLAGLVLKATEGAQKAKAVKLATDNAFLSASDAWVFDEDAGCLYSA